MFCGSDDIVRTTFTSALLDPQALKKNRTSKGVFVFPLSPLHPPSPWHGTFTSLAYSVCYSTVLFTFLFSYHKVRNVLVFAFCWMMLTSFPMSDLICFLNALMWKCSFFFFLRDTVSLYDSLGCPETQRDAPASASQVLGSKVCTTTAWWKWNFLMYN